MDDKKTRFDGSADSLSDGPWSSPFGDLLEGQGWGGDGPLHETPSAEPTIGTPQEDAAHFPGAQSYQDTCAIRCQEFILEMFTGLEFSEDRLVQECYDHGWYVPSQGTAQEDVGKLLELHGVPVRSYENGTIFHLAQELGQGHKVIIGVDSGDLWESSVLEAIQDQLGFRQEDHAVIVSGIDTSDPNNPHVVVSDPGAGQAAARYPLEQFLDAWADSNFMVATTEPAPSHLPEMAHFDCEAGHIPEVAGLPWEEFETFEAHPEEWVEQFVEGEHDSPPRDFAGAEEAATAIVHEGAHTPEAEHETDAAEEAALDAEAQRHLDEIERAALRHELDSALDPDAFTNKYDD